MGNLMIGSIYPLSLFHGGSTISKVMCGNEQIWPSATWWVGNYVKAHLIEHDEYNQTHTATVYFSRNNSKVLIEGDDRNWQQWPYGYGVIDKTHANHDGNPPISEYLPREIDTLSNGMPDIHDTPSGQGSMMCTVYTWGRDGVHYALAHNINEITMECWYDGSQKPTTAYSGGCITTPTETKKYADIVIDCAAGVVSSNDADEVRVVSNGYEVYYNTTETSIYKYTISHEDAWFGGPTIDMVGNRIRIFFPTDYIRYCRGYWANNDFDIYVGNIMPATIHLYAILTPELSPTYIDKAKVFQGDILTTGVGTFDTAGITSYWGRFPHGDTRDALIIKINKPYGDKRWIDDEAQAIAPHSIYIDVEPDADNNLLLYIDKAGLMDCFGPFHKPGELTISISPTIIE